MGVCCPDAPAWPASQNSRDWLPSWWSPALRAGEASAAPIAPMNFQGMRVFTCLQTTDTSSSSPVGVRVSSLPCFAHRAAIRTRIFGNHCSWAGCRNYGSRPGTWAADNTPQAEPDIHGSESARWTPHRLPRLSPALTRRLARCPLLAEARCHYRTPVRAPGWLLR